MAKAKEITTKQLIEAIKLEKKFEQKCRDFFNEIVNFASELNDTYHRKSRQEELFEQATEELGFEYISYEDTFDGPLDGDLEINWAGIPQGRNKMTRVSVRGYFDDKTEEYTVPLKYLIDLSATKAVLKKYRDIMKWDTARFESYKVEEVINKITLELIDQVFKPKPGRKKEETLCEKFDKIGSEMFADWEEMAIEVKAVNFPEIDGLRRASIVYTVDDGEIQNYIA